MSTDNLSPSTQIRHLEADAILRLVSSAEFWQQQQHLAATATRSGFATPTSQPQSASSYHQSTQSNFSQSYNSPFNQTGMGMGMGMGIGIGMGMGMGDMGKRMQPQSMPSSHQQQPVAASSAKGKGKLVELDDADWEAQFARVGDPSTKLDDDDTQHDTQHDTHAVPATLLEDSIELEANEADAALLKELEATWANLQDNLKQGSLSDDELAKWEAQYGSQFASQHFDEAEGEGEMDLPGAPQVWTRDNVDAFLDDQSDFLFQEDNGYLDLADPFAEGQRLLREGAPLSEAALAFEAACRRDPGRAEAWKAAGETWAADERESKGISALERAVACGGAEAVGAWMSLAVAYVNEGQEMRALATLDKWVSLAYPQLSASPLEGGAQQQANPWTTSQRVIDLFISAAQAGPSARVPGQSSELNSAVDPDVQVGLGVLFYSNADYAKARDCFEAALTARPADFLLWNRLGATLANGGEPEAAISAYRRALELRPTFTRATYNLGVSCLNIGCYQEAAEHLLAALEGQRTGEERGDGFDGAADDGSANLWHTLRRAFLCMVSSIGRGRES